MKDISSVNKILCYDVDTVIVLNIGTPGPIKCTWPKIFTILILLNIPGVCCILRKGVGLI